MFTIHLENLIHEGYKYDLGELLANLGSIYSATQLFQDDRSVGNSGHTAAPRTVLRERALAQSTILENDVDDAGADGTPTKRLSDAVKVSYSFQQEQFFAEQVYAPAAVEYQKPFYDEHPFRKSTFKSEPEYEVEMSPVKENLAVEAEEVTETMKKIQYSSLWGSISDISFEERRELNYRILFNQLQFNLEQSHALTQNVNYGPLL